MADTDPSKFNARPPQLGAWVVPILVTMTIVMVLWYFIGTPLEQLGNLLGSITLVVLILSGIFLVVSGRCAGNPTG